jgi:hypothetical protein
MAETRREGQSDSHQMRWQKRSTAFATAFTWSGHAVGSLDAGNYDLLEPQTNKARLSTRGIVATDMLGYKFTEYFEKEVMRKRPYLKKEWCVKVIENSLKVEPQERNRFRFWGLIDDLEGRVLRVVTLEDKKTIHNAFPDRRYKP